NTPSSTKAPTVRRSLALALIALLTGGASAFGQAPYVRVRAASNDTLSVDSSNVATMAFVVENPGTDAAEVDPTLALPRGWTTVMGAHRMTIAAGGSDIWLVSVTAPANAAAGLYLIRAGAGSSQTRSEVAAVVRVDARRALEAAAVDVP